jgi:hypothetical protein
MTMYYLFLNIALNIIKWEIVYINKNKSKMSFQFENTADLLKLQIKKT